MAEIVRIPQGEGVEAAGSPTRSRPTPPPRIQLPREAEQLTSQADQSADELRANLNTTKSELKRVYCQWFSYYLETGQAVPSSAEFPRLLIQHILGRILPAAPLDKRLHDAANKFRAAIERGQTTTEDAQNAAMAGVCA